MKHGFTENSDSQISDNGYLKVCAVEVFPGERKMLIMQFLKKAIILSAWFVRMEERSS
ncbi:MAG: hypothetical protein L3J18_16455 [Candidatus Brocadia sp.]|nr:hypothetical protein [Candidatus Brocadia sp.]UJS20462.1 MAG: hypothetical protein L3J18_16455 [Candidatus Brocadia sp.]